MPRQITIEIPVLVGSNGLWCASGYTSTAEDGCDWGFLADSLQNEDGSFPTTERRFIVRATLLVPDEAPEVVQGTIEA